MNKSCETKIDQKITKGLKINITNKFKIKTIRK